MTDYTYSGNVRNNIHEEAADSIEYLMNQNKLLKTKLRQLTDKYKDLENQYNKIWEENHNIRIVKKAGEVS